MRIAPPAALTVSAEQKENGIATNTGQRKALEQGSPNYMSTSSSKISSPVHVGMSYFLFHKK